MYVHGDDEEVGLGESGICEPDVQFGAPLVKAFSIKVLLDCVPAALQ